MPRLRKSFLQCEGSNSVQGSYTIGKLQIIFCCETWALIFIQMVSQFLPTRETPKQKHFLISKSAIHGVGYFWCLCLDNVLFRFPINQLWPLWIYMVIFSADTALVEVIAVLWRTSNNIHSITLGCVFTMNRVRYSQSLPINILWGGRHWLKDKMCSVNNFHSERQKRHK